MQLSKAKEKAIANCPWLVKCLDTYFAPGEFKYDRSNIVDVKWRRDGYYAVVLFQVEDQMWVADIAGTYENDFEVCNDSEACEDLAQWKSVKIDPFCDGFVWSVDG